MSPATLDALLGASRILCYGGFVLLAGAFLLWGLVWPEGRGDRRLLGVAVLGIATTAIGSLAGPVLEYLMTDRSLPEILPPIAGAALLVRLAALCAVAFFLPDLLSAAVRGWRRAVACGVIVVIALTLAIQPDAVTALWQALPAFVVLVIVAYYGRQQAVRAEFRRRFPGDTAIADGGTGRLSSTITLQLAVAFAVLALTTWLIMTVP